MRHHYEFVVKASLYLKSVRQNEQESQAIADKPARRESLSKLLQFDVPTTLSLTILAYLHALTAIASEISTNSLKIHFFGIQGHPRSSILVSIESPYVTCY